MVRKVLFFWGHPMRDRLGVTLGILTEEPAAESNRCGFCQKSVQKGQRIAIAPSARLLAHEACYQAELRRNQARHVVAHHLAARMVAAVDEFFREHDLGAEIDEMDKVHAAGIAAHLFGARAHRDGHSLDDVSDTIQEAEGCAEELDKLLRRGGALEQFGSGVEDAIETLLTVVAPSPKTEASLEPPKWVPTRSHRLAFLTAMQAASVGPRRPVETV